jgi:hypothetical protein
MPLLNFQILSEGIEPSSIKGRDLYSNPCHWRASDIARLTGAQRTAQEALVQHVTIVLG